jgi:putative SOS response-associated peptidase YedK
MCSNYKAVTLVDHLVSFFGVSRDFKGPPLEFAADIWPLKLAPMIRLDELGRRRVETGQFGLLPHFAKEVAYGRRTYNARSETVHSKPSYRDAWKRSQRCIIPAQQIYEPCYESGKPVRWAIEQSSGAPMGIAGIYTDHPVLKRSSGEPVISFAMLTVNAEGHPVFMRMHAPEDEKRMVVILHPDDYDHWLTCAPEEATELFKQWHGPLNAFPKPLPPRKKKVAPDD